MNVCSRWIGLERVEAGMILSEPLMDDKGDMLLPGGATLTDTMIITLRRRGVEMLPVVHEGGQEQVTDPNRQQEIDRARERIAKLFRRCGSEGTTGILLKCIALHRTGQCL